MMVFLRARFRGVCRLGVRRFEYRCHPMDKLKFTNMADPTDVRCDFYDNLTTLQGVDCAYVHTETVEYFDHGCG